MELDTVAKIRLAFYRLVGSESGDIAITERGEGDDDVAYLFLTRGFRTAQRFMLKNGYQGWRKRSAALTFSGSDSADGGRYVSLPEDFLRAYGTAEYGRSALVEADGSRWGEEIRADEDHMEGSAYYFRGDKLWLARTASPPSTIYLDYHYKHPLMAAATVMDFPMDARALGVAYAANTAKEEDWIPGVDADVRIERAVRLAEAEARDIARPSKQQRVLRPPTRYGNHW